MSFIGLLGVGLFVITSASVGARLLLLWRKTKELPELLLTITLWSLGVFGFALSMIAQSLDKSSGQALVAGAIALCAESVGCGALVVFAWRVFQAHKPWGRWLGVSLLAYLVAGFLVELLSGQFVHYGDSLPANAWILVGVGARCLSPIWLIFECLRFYGMLKRRLKLGLAEPLVVNRVLLWGVANVATALAYFLTFYHRAVYGTGLKVHPWAINSAAMLAMVSAICVGLAFFPPPAYRRWMERGDAERTSAPP